MIFYSFFTERWLASTDELSMVEECAYLRLVNWQYRNECALPLDLTECCRIARVTSRIEREGVSKVLRVFYLGTPEGYVQTKVTHEVARFQAGEPARVARREANRSAKERSRNLQQRLYLLCRENSIPTRKGMRLTELRDLLLAAGVEVDKSLLAVDNSHTGKPGERVLPTYAVSTGVSAGVSVEGPSNVSNVQNPQPMTHSVSSRHTGGVLTEGEIGAISASAAADPERVGEAVRSLRSGGLQGINAGHPMLHALVAAGATADSFTFAAAHAVGKGKGFAYALAIVQGQMQEAAQAAAGGLAKPVERNRVSEWAPGLEANP